MLRQRWASHLALCFLNTPMAPHANLVKLLAALQGGQAQSPYLIQTNENDEGAICGGTLFHMMPQGHGRGGPWGAVMVCDDGQQQVVLTLCCSAWHGWLNVGCFVCGLGGLSARQS